MVEARARYTGLRVTLTETPGHAIVLSASVKRREGAWDEWTRLVPTSILRDNGGIASVQHALDIVRRYLDEVEDTYGQL